MQDIILQKLQQIEQQHQVRIILAIESGSRAWGFPSPDSDYDVRFIYAHTVDWYLSVFEKRDVIELPIDAVLDISGWDIKKALQLLRKSNPALMEWLASPMVYQQQNSLLQPLLDFSQTSFLPESSCHHYLSMANNHLQRYANSEQAKLKAYLYTLRPLLCAQWVIDKGSQPPVLFDTLVQAYIHGSAIEAEVADLLALKQASEEVHSVARIMPLEQYMHRLYQSLELKIPKNPAKQDTADFDAVFRQIIKQQ